VIVSIPITSIGGNEPNPELLRRIAQTSRKTLERFVAAAIDALDTVDGDPDLEEDDPCGQIDEDGVNTVTPNQSFRWRDTGPGCEISDPDVDIDSYGPQFIPQCTPLFAKRR